MVGIQKANIGQVKPNLQQQDVQKKDDGQGVKAKGIGVLKKIWLHLSGNAGNRHSQQLKNLKTQVKNSFGDSGLRNLNELLNDKGWDGASTKLFSSKELRSVRIDVTKKALESHVMDLVNNPKTFKIMEAFAKKELSTENTSFLKEMVPLSVGGSGKDRDTKTLIGIYDRFIGPNAKEQVNLPSRVLNPLVKARKELNQAIQGNDQTKIDTAKNELHFGLNLARKEIDGLIQRDTLGRLQGDADLGPQFDKALSELAVNMVKMGGLPKNQLKLIDVKRKAVKRKFARKKKAAIRKNQNVQIRKKPGVKVEPIQVKKKEQQSVAPKKVVIKKERESVAPKKVVIKKAQEKVAPKKVALKKGPKPALDARPKLKNFLGRTPGVRNHPKLSKLSKSEVDEINKLFADGTELLAINKAKEKLRAKA